jgi:hypothetical protein
MNKVNSWGQCMAGKAKSKGKPKTRAAKKTVRKKSVRKKTPAVKKGSAQEMKEMLANQKVLWASYRKLQDRVDKAWHKLESDVKRRAHSEVIYQDRNDLLLLLGECDYMARECIRQSGRKKRSR